MSKVIGYRHSGAPGMIKPQGQPRVGEFGVSFAAIENRGATLLQPILEPTCCESGVMKRTLITIDLIDDVRLLPQGDAILGV